MIKKIFRLSVFLLFTLAMLALTVRIIIVMPAVQTWLVKKVTNYLSDELKTRVEVKQVDIAFFRTIVLKDIYIQDLEKDTLLYSRELKVNISRFNYQDKSIVIKSMELNDARVAIRKYKNIKGLNFHFLVDYFSPSENDTSASPAWDVQLKNVLLNNTTFTYRDLRYDDKTPCIDLEDIVVTKLNADLRDFKFVRDTVLFRTHQLSLNEKSGFILTHFESDVKMSNQQWDFQNLISKTKESIVKGNINLSFNDINDFDDFVHKVKVQSSFEKSLISFNDVKYFSKDVIGIDKTITFSGNIRGTVDRLKGKNMLITYTPQCLYKGDVMLNGLPEIEETYIELNVNELRLNKKDIETFPAFPFNEGKKIVLPSNLEYLGNVKFKGKFSGFYNDFVAYGNASTALGFFSSDINLKITENNPAEYSGHLSTINFDIGKLLKLQPEVGRITARVEINGSGLAVETINTKLDGTINEFEVKGYAYHNLVVKGAMAKKLFSGSLLARDANADFDFNGQVDYRGNLPVFDFVADVRVANLALLNLVERDVSSSLSTRAELHCTGNEINNLTGSISFINTNYKEFQRGITINNLSIISSKFNNQKQIILQSDFADASMKGDFKLSEIFQSAGYILSQYIPAIKVKTMLPLNNQTFDYQIDLKETRGVLDILLPELNVFAGTHVEGKFNTATNYFSAMLQSEEVVYNGVKFGGINMAGNTVLGKLSIATRYELIQLNDSLLLRNVLLNGTAHRDSANFNLLVANTDTSLSKLNIGFNMRFRDNGITQVKLFPNEILIDRNNWILDPENYLVSDSSGVAISHFNFNSGDQQLRVEGKISNNLNDKLTVEFKNFNVAVSNNILKVYRTQIGGIVNGNAIISSLYKKPLVNADLRIKSLSLYNDTLGDASFVSDWNTDKGIININGIVTRGGEQNISVIGQYIIKDKNDELNFDITLKKTAVKTFSSYLEGIASDFSGIVSGDFHLYGTLSKPLLTGDAHLQKVNFKIDYLNTIYSLSTDVSLKENYIGINHVIVNDAKGNQAIVNGKIQHKNLQNFYFDIDIAANKTQVLNTSIHNNDIFYGVAYATGRIKIFGYLDYIKMDIGLRSEKGTEINIPLSNPEEVTNSSFITFIKQDAVKDSLTANEIDLSGIEMNFDLDITPDASIRLEFDPKIGDVIKGTGHGNITMNISPAEGLKMFGDYIIEDGKYLFTLQNVINKEFDIEKGGYIRWSGNPYDAYVNINANYSNLKATLYDLIPDSTAGYKRLVPVTLTLNISEKLFNPVIKFDIKVQNVDATTQDRVDRAIATEEEKYRQAVSLLVIRRFSPSEELSNRPQVNTSDVVGTNAYEFLSRQLSNWASQINKNVNLGVNYQPGSTLTQEQWEVALSTSFFNDRVTVDGNLGVANNSAASTDANTSSIVGDFNVEVKANKDGRVRLKAFNRSNNNSLINNLNSQYTQGIGVFYREEFDSRKELWQRIKDRFSRKKPAV